MVLGIALVDFLAQNTRSVRIEFFSASGHVPTVVALLVAALAGAALVLIVGLARIGQLRRSLRSRDGARKEAQTVAAEPKVHAAEPHLTGEVGESGEGAASVPPPTHEPVRD